MSEHMKRPTRMAIANEHDILEDTNNFDIMQNFMLSYKSVRAGRVIAIPLIVTIKLGQLPSFFELLLYTHLDKASQKKYFARENEGKCVHIILA
uniref:Uncharacterized protein n=1 Tax=Lactuca sativa TaxID=4236 RepID=A0A9R1UVN1_LACSA|nr:hypothetical protein LSAT_V11C700381700 [Lactuca sativa]